ncbi:MAG: Hsp20/alpha crystallin family protein [Candidatus Diapherotrites archaeon]|nr:Hsp20/alpha crystallin family protein [Candidatus Diapherotrites archaeon]
METWVKKQNFSRFPIDFEELEYLLSELIEEVFDLESIDIEKPLELIFSLRFDERGAVQIERFGNRHISRTKETLVASSLCDIVEQKNYLILTAELPTLKKNEISLQADKNRLCVFSAKTRNLVKEFFLPNEIEPQVINCIFKNSVLEVVLKKKEF